MPATLAETIAAAGFPVYLRGFSAIDSYLYRSNAPAESAASAGYNAVYAVCGAGLADLARLFDNLRYPGADLADAAADSQGKTWYFRCVDPDESADRHDVMRNCPGCAASAFLEFFQDCKTRRFYDPNGIYPLLRQIRKRDENHTENFISFLPSVNSAFNSSGALFDMAMILAKYFPNAGPGEINKIAAGFNNEGCRSFTEATGSEQQRRLLAGLLGAANPAPGFELLKKAGFISSCWPELAALDDVDHSKEFHPEGNVWKHTMEALRYRKASGASGRCGASGNFDLMLSLALLLHDTGKPLSNSSGSRRFDRHAELGESQARRFLLRLGFDSALTKDVCYLVRNHMLPAALPRLPLSRTGEIMESHLFPALMELYRCDESSSFKGLNGYYQTSAAYRAYLKRLKNPYGHL